MATTTWSASSNIELASVVSLDHLLGQLDTLRNPNNLFFAVRIDGQFSYVHTRAVCKAEPGVGLVDAASGQAEFDFHTIADPNGRKDVLRDDSLEEHPSA